VAIRRPLVQIAGQIQELPASDTLPGVGAGADSFETVSKNLSATDATLNYTDGVLTSIVYTSAGITKTLAYGPDGLATVTLSGATPGGIDLVKTFNYTGGNLTSFTYS
jgi:hypothetical protein